MMKPEAAVWKLGDMLNEIPYPKMKKFLGVALALDFDLVTAAMTMG
jgi:hypothetical protein